MKANTAMELVISGGTESEPSMAMAGDIIVTTANDIVDATDGVTSLREAIELANTTAGQDTIQFAAGVEGTTLQLDLGELLVTDDLVIDGGGTTIDAQDQSRAFNIQGKFADPLDVSMNGLNLTNGFDAGPVAYGGGGGGMYIYHADVSLSNASITDNNADNGGAIAKLGVSTLVLNQMSLTGNHADTVGGAIFSAGGVTITDSTLSDNTANSGGALYADLPSGAENTQTVTIAGSTISGNSGTAISMHEVALSVTGSSFANNSGSWGGAINLGSSYAEISNSSFTGNNASGSGGAIGGPSPGEGDDPGSLTIENSSFDGNTAGTNGGAVSAATGSITIGTSSFTNNSAHTGGAVSVNVTEGYTTDAVIIESAFAGNNAHNGGALWLRGPTTITNSTIVDNHALAYGGGIHISNVGAEVAVRHSTIVENTSQAGGGGIKATGPATLTIENSIVALNDGTKAWGDDVDGWVDDSNGHNIFGSGAVSDNPGDIINATAEQLVLGPLADNGGPTETMALQSGSIAIDAGDFLWILYDQRGEARDALRDIGSFEFDDPPMARDPRRGDGDGRKLSGRDDEDGSDGIFGRVQADVGAEPDMGFGLDNLDII